MPKINKKPVTSQGVLTLWRCREQASKPSTTGILLLTVGRCFTLTSLIFTPFQISAQGFGLPLTTLVNPFLVPSGSIAGISAWLFGLVFRHYLLFRTLIIVRHGGA